MPLAHDLSSQSSEETLARQCADIRATLIRDGLFDDTPNSSRAGASWRLSPAPFLLSPHEHEFFQALGRHLLAFYRALNRLYNESVKGRQPGWAAAYLDQGKPDSLVAYSRMKRFRDQVPAVIRPDIIPTETGMVITELDSVPGGIGLTACMGKIYGQWAIGNGPGDKASVPSPITHYPSPIPHHPLPMTHDPSPLPHHPFEIVGGPDGMVQGFARMVRSFLDGLPESDRSLAIVVSDEAADYRPEMTWLAARLRAFGIEAFCCHPRDVRFTEEGLRVGEGPAGRPIGLLYRFFELFDLNNIPKAELILYSAKKERVLVTPPFKPALEEKLAFALLHHPRLTPFWFRELGGETYALLLALMPKTWILDPRPVPPTAVIPGLAVAGQPVADWHDLAGATQKNRLYVIKPSGFSELAWGSRGLSVGQDLSQTDWTAAIERALASFPSTPYILQEFHKGRQVQATYHDPAGDRIVPMAGRVRLSPYYFVSGDRADLGGILATICPPDKKLIHGMKDAIMAPCSVATRIAS
jgi:hypothetical protein